MSACWPITLTGPSGKSSTHQGMRPWCPLSVSLCLRPTKRLSIWLQGEMQVYSEFRWLLLNAWARMTWLWWDKLFMSLCLCFFLQNWAVIPECPGTVAPLPHQHEECGVLALSHGWYTSHPQLECGLSMFEVLSFPLKALIDHTFQHQLMIICDNQAQFWWSF